MPSERIFRRPLLQTDACYSAIPANTASAAATVSSISSGVCAAETKPASVGRRAEGDAAFQHTVEEMFETVDNGTRHVGIVLRRMAGKIQTKHAAHAVRRKFNAMYFSRIGNTVGKALGQGSQVFIEASR